MSKTITRGRVKIRYNFQDSPLQRGHCSLSSPLNSHFRRGRLPEGGKTKARDNFQNRPPTLPLLFFTLLLIRIFVQDDHQRENLYLQNRPPTLLFFTLLLIFVVIWRILISVYFYIII